MAANKKPRKRHQPRQVMPHAAFNALHRQHTMDDGQTTDLGIAYWTALDIHLRSPDSQQWGVLASTMNIAIVLCERGHGDGTDIIRSALDGLQRAKERAESGKSWALDADCIRDVRAALEIHDTQVQTAKIIEMRNALHEVHRRIKCGIAYGI